MKIINPIYDKAFKYLMQNEKYARKVLSVILDTDIKEVALEQQEFTYIDEQRKISLFRLDFKATILQEDGQEKTVLIELQKSKNPFDIQRFRSYLGSHYMAGEKKEVDQSEGRPHRKIYPIITIYMLGYNLTGNPYLAVRSAQTLTDVTTRKLVELDNDFFLKYVTHECYLIQVRRLPAKRQHRLELFFTLFNQAWIAEEDYLLDLEEVPEEFAEIADYLHRPVLDEGFRKQLEVEGEVARSFEDLELQLSQAREREEEERKLKEEAKRKEEEAKAREEEERRLREEAEARERQLIIHLAKSYSVPEIAKIIGLSVPKIETILGQQ